MGYAKTYDPHSVSISDTVLAVNNGAYAVNNVAPFQKYLWFTVVTNVAANIWLRIDWDYMATAPDECYIEIRKNGSTVIASGNWVGAWTTATANVNITNLQQGDTIELWAYGTTGATAEIRNFKLYGIESPFYASE